MLRVGRRASSCWRVLLAGARQTKPTAPSPWPVVTSGFAARSLLNRYPGKLSFRAFQAPTLTFSTLAGRYITPTTVIQGTVAGHKKVQVWLFCCTGWVFSLVVLGGVTRLTRSGLSMTDWKFTGSLPPLSPDQWRLEFDKYKQSPEYKRVNQGMNLEQFKFIYWMEYAHRMWGRGLGLIFALPFAYFGLKGCINRPLAIRLGVLFGMGGAQGFVGWWMVKSGLEEPESEHVQPRVSPYRLALHLTSAFAIYSGLLWTALSVGEYGPVTGPSEMMRVNRKLRRLVVPVAALVGLTALSGAFVAGNDAGRAFNTFPKMGDRWIPEDVLALRPVFKNFFENTSTVQLDHRILATATLFSVGSIWLATRQLPLNPKLRLLLNSALWMTAAQVTLGVSTLLAYVPVSLGAAHQAGALTLFSIFVTLLHALKQPKSLSRIAPALLRPMKQQNRGVVGLGLAKESA